MPRASATPSPASSTLWASDQTIDRLAIAVLVAHYGDRSTHLPPLWARLGRLYPRRVRRPSGRALCIGISRHTRAVLGEPLHVRRWVRSRRRALGEGRAVQPVRDTTADGRGGRYLRAVHHMAPRSPDRRPARRPDRPRAACDLPALLRPHVHEPEGHPLRGRNGAAAARPHAGVRGISGAVRLDRPCCSASGSG